MKKYAIIVAGGIGSRMKVNMPKQFLLLKNKPILFYTLDTFLKSFSDLQIILVLPQDYMAAGQDIINEYFSSDRIKITVGGSTRFQSVKNGLQLITEESIVFVHDGVRCLLSVDLIHRCYQSAVEYGSAIPVINSKDSVRLVLEKGNEALERDRVKLVQTPQTFQSKILLPAFAVDYLDQFTDEATVVEAFGMKVHLIVGEEQNIKITQPIDLLLAECIINTASDQ
jgi:2-C-methyl-D-erythritol 4-phosphate cytidylyltransferase